MRRTVVHNEEAPLGLGIPRRGQHLGQGTLERFNAALGAGFSRNTATEPVQEGERAEGPVPLILALLAARASRSRGEAPRDAGEGLQAGHFVGAEDEIPGTKWLPLPLAVVEAQQGGGSLQQAGVAGKEPLLLEPGADRIPSERALESTLSS
jgi:hypothetical protein